MFKVVWTDAALAHVDAIIDYIDPFNPEAGRRLAQRILDAGDSLCDFPIAAGRSATASASLR